MSKKVIIIGAGISGLVSGIYCLKNGFDVCIYEKNSFSGGLLVNSIQKNSYNDSFNYFIYNDELKFIYDDIGLNDIQFEESEYYLEYNGIYLYKDLKKLEEELISLSQFDIKKVKTFIKAIQEAQKCKLLYDKAIDCMSFFEMIKNSTKMNTNNKIYKKYKGISISKYFSDFHSNEIKSLFQFLPEDTSMYVLLFLLAKYTDGSMKKLSISSKEMIDLIEKKFIELGGKIEFNKSATSIDIKSSKVLGVWFNEKHYVNADIVIGALDANHFYNDLLKSKYKDRKFELMKEDYKTYPMYSLLNFNFNIKGDIDNLSYMFMIDVNRNKFATSIINKLVFTKRKNNIITCNILQSNEDYIYWKLLSKNPSVYNKELNKLVAVVREELKKHLENVYGKQYKIKDMDCNTLLDYEVKYNAFKSCIYSFGFNKSASSFSFDGRVAEVRNLYYTGQWLSNPGGYLNAIINAYYVSDRIKNDN